MDLIIRAARVEDAAEVARLSGELGYVCSAEQMAKRLGELLTRDSQFIAVASLDGTTLLGWVAVESRLILEVGERAEITGLVVDANARRSGIGARLVVAAESWARASGHDTMLVRSNAVRQESHPFYERYGYSRVKTQHVYTRHLAV